MMKRETRQRKGFLGICEAARVLGLEDYQQITYHGKCGRIPEPTYKISGRCYFTPDEITVMKVYFGGRRRYQHQADVFERNREEE